MRKLLFDRKLSFELVEGLADLFPGSTHVGAVALSRAADEGIWRFAAAREFLIVNEDEDFRRLSMLRSSPPKLVWVQAGYCATLQMKQLIRRRFPAIESFSRSTEATCLKLRVDAVSQDPPDGRVRGRVRPRRPPGLRPWGLGSGRLVPAGAGPCTLVETL
jgi:predicted nuclease of predicted toxin-antitoxin system